MMTDYRERMEGGDMSDILLKIKAIIGLAVIASVAGFFAYLAGVDYTVAFGPAVGSIASAIVGYAVKESLPRIEAYLRSAFGVKPDGSR